MHYFIQLCFPSELEEMVDHSEMYPEQETQFKIVEVFSMDSSQFSGSNGLSAVLAEEESDSDVLVVDHDFGFGAPVELEASSSDELHSTVQPGELCEKISII